MKLIINEEHIPEEYNIDSFKPTYSSKMLLNYFTTPLKRLRDIKLGWAVFTTKLKQMKNLMVHAAILERLKYSITICVFCISSLILVD